MPIASAQLLTAPHPVTWVAYDTAADQISVEWQEVAGTQDYELNYVNEVSAQHPLTPCLGRSHNLNCYRSCGRYYRGSTLP